VSTGETPGQGKPRGGNGRFTRSVDTAERDALAARLRARDMSFREIAQKLGYANESGACKAVARALAAVPVQDVAQLRALELERLDELSRRLWKVFDTKYPLVTDGPQLVDKTGAYVEDPKPLLTVVDRLLRISERRAKLLGLDAAPAARVDVITEETALAVAAVLEAQLAELRAHLAQQHEIEPADTRDARTLLSLPTVLQGETEAVHRDR